MDEGEGTGRKRRLVEITKERRRRRRGRKKQKEKLSGWVSFYLIETRTIAKRHKQRRIRGKKTKMRGVR